MVTKDNTENGPSIPQSKMSYVFKWSNKACLASPGSNRIFQPNPIKGSPSVRSCVLCVFVLHICIGHVSTTAQTPLSSLFACSFIILVKKLQFILCPSNLMAACVTKPAGIKPHQGGMKSLKPLKPAAADRPARWRSNQETSSGRLAV